jgi:mono/diheme cytochrome c family protein
MRPITVLCASAVLGVTLALASATTGATTMIMKSAMSGGSLVGTGKMLISKDHCNACHSADLKGKQGFSPSLTPTGPMRHYTKKTFEVFMATGKMDDGKLVGQPMLKVCKVKAADSDAMYAYLKTVK